MRGAEDRPWGGDGGWERGEERRSRGGVGGEEVLDGGGGGTGGEAVDEGEGGRGRGGIGDVVWQEGVFLGVVDMLGTAGGARKCLQQTLRIFHGLAGNASRY